MDVDPMPPAPPEPLPAAHRLGALVVQAAAETKDAEMG
jgi:hypothetical protein